MPVCSKCKNEVKVTLVEQHVYENNGKVFVGQYAPKSHKTVKEVFGVEAVKQSFKDVCEPCLKKHTKKYF